MAALSIAARSLSRELADAGRPVASTAAPAGGSMVVRAAG